MRGGGGAGRDPAPVLALPGALPATGARDLGCRPPLTLSETDAVKPLPQHKHDHLHSWDSGQGHWGVDTMRSSGLSALTCKAAAIIAEPADVLRGPHSSGTHGQWCTVRDMRPGPKHQTPGPHGADLQYVGFETGKVQLPCVCVWGGGGGGGIGSVGLVRRCTRWVFRSRQGRGKRGGGGFPKKTGTLPCGLVRVQRLLRRSVREVVGAGVELEPPTPAPHASS